MAFTEIQVLKFIWENKGKASWLRIVRELRIFSPDYCRLICKSLIKNKFIEFSEGRYKITNLGKKELEKSGIIKKAEKIIKPPKAKKPRKPKKPKKKKIKAKREIKIKEEAKGAPIAELSGLASELREKLKKKGLQTLESIATTSAVRLTEMIKGLELKKAAKIINQAREKLRKRGKTFLWE